jgi:hypothetical protein
MIFAQAAINKHASNKKNAAIISECWAQTYACLLGSSSE